MKLGGPVMEPCSSPEEWLAYVKRMGYGAVNFPVDYKAPQAVVDRYVELCRENGLYIAEVGAWSNPLDRDPAVRSAAMEKCKKQLELAEYVGAGCCVNIAGGHGTAWDGPHPDSFSQETFDEVVGTVREIIDSVNPVRTKYSLEMMPYMIPDSPESFVKLMKAVDRTGFGVHVDIVNIINSPYRYYANKGVIDECFDLLGDSVISCHAKDIWLENQLTTHLNERVPGDGFLDYAAYIGRVNSLGGDVAFMLEHLHSQEELDRGLAFVRKTAAGIGIKL